MILNNYTNTCQVCGIEGTMNPNAKVTTPTCRKAQTGTIHPDGSVTCEPIPENCPNVVRPIEVTPAIIQTSIRMPNGTNFRVYTSGGTISSFICDENWNVPKEPYATSPIFEMTAVDYHKFVRSQHGEDCVVKELSTEL